MKSLGVGFDSVAFGSIEVDLDGPSVRLADPGPRPHPEAAAEVARFEVDLGVLPGPDGEVAIAEVVALR